MSVQKLWVAYVTSKRTFGPSRVSTQGCEYVDDLLDKLKEKFDIPGPPSHLTLYQPDGVTEIDVGDSPAD